MILKRNVQRSFHHRHLMHLLFMKTPFFDDSTAPFYECFRYGRFPDVPAAAAETCEAHNDVGCITISLASTLGKGLEVYDMVDGVWLDAEAPMMTNNNNNNNNTLRMIVFFGDFMEYMTRGKVMCTPHRVVVPPPSFSSSFSDDDDDDEARYSTIYEVIPHPNAVVPIVTTSTATTTTTTISSCSNNLTGRDVFNLK
eukprot:PhM_4_TR18488/c2_g1_i1/m.65360